MLHRPKQFSVVVTACLLLLIPVEASGAVVCICVRSGLKASAVRGRVVATSKKRPEEPIPNATVKLLKCIGADCQTIAEVATDASGHFAIEGVKPGEYDIVAGTPHFESVWVQLKVRGGTGDKNQEIVFGLEAGGGCCKGWAKVRKIK